MKGNKGFVLTEALVISAIVLAALILIYAQFARINRAYSNEYSYNNVSGIYKLKQIDTYLQDEDSSYERFMNSVDGYLDITDCSFADNEKYCKMLVSSADIKHLLIAANDKVAIMSKLKENNPYKLKFTNFIKTVDDSDITYGGLLIAEFNDETYAAIPIAYGFSVSKCDTEIGTTWTFSYKNSAHEWTAPCRAKYKIEAWGAGGGTGSGGSSATNSVAGLSGSYTKGVIRLATDTKLYLHVGSKGTGCSNGANGGYNGGGKGVANSCSYGAGGGGGATDIRYFGKNVTPTSSDLAWNSNLGLNSRIMVAAGGGGARSGVAGGGVLGYVYGGGFTGGATQTTGYAFGYSGNSTALYTDGGGGGYYGGEGITSGEYKGFGGNSYISGHTGCVAIAKDSTTNPRAILKSGCVSGTTDNTCSIHYSGLKFEDTVMVDGNGYVWTNERAASASSMPNTAGTGTMTGNSGAGYAKITLVSY